LTEGILGEITVARIKKIQKELSDKFIVSGVLLICIGVVPESQCKQKGIYFLLFFVNQLEAEIFNSSKAIK